MSSPRRLTVDVADLEVVTRAENCMPKIPHEADEIEVRCTPKRNLEELQLQITHLPHMPTR